MNRPRRQFLRLIAGGAALSASSRATSAQTYPSRPVRWVVGFAPGGGNDIVARLMGQWLSERTGQPFIIENRPGGGTNIATEAVVNAPPDGYTLLLAGLPNASNAIAVRQAQFQFHPRHHAGRGHHAHPQCHRGQSIRSGQDRPRVHRLRQSQSRQGQHGLGRERERGPSRRRTVQDDGRRQPCPCAVSRQRAGADGPARGTGGGAVRLACPRRSSSSKPESCAHSRSPARSARTHCRTFRP